MYAGTTLLTLKRTPALAKRAIGKAQPALNVYEVAAPADRSTWDMLAARLDLAGAHLVLEAVCRVQHVAEPPERGTRRLRSMMRAQPNPAFAGTAHRVIEMAGVVGTIPALCRTTARAAR